MHPLIGELLKAKLAADDDDAAAAADHTDTAGTGESLTQIRSRIKAAIALVPFFNSHPTTTARIERHQCRVIPPPPGLSDCDLSVPPASAPKRAMQWGDRAMGNQRPAGQAAAAAAADVPSKSGMGSHQDAYQHRAAGARGVAACPHRRGNCAGSVPSTAPSRPPSAHLQPRRRGPRRDSLGTRFTEPGMGPDRCEYRHRGGLHTHRGHPGDHSLRV